MRKSIIYLLIYILIFVIIFRSLLMNITTNLFDWLDYPFCTWLINRNIDKIINFDLNYFFDLNIFYPFKNTLFFSDLLLPQSLLGIPVRILTSNPVMIFNFIFIITFTLNYLSLYNFWNLIFKNCFISFLGSLSVIFSSFFFLEISHFQMMSYWPFFFSLYFLIKSFNKHYKLNSALSGIFCGIQFLAAAYFSVFLFYTISIFLFIKILFNQHKLQTLKRALFFIFTFLLVSGLFIKGYLDTKRQYSIVRNPNEYIQYSANLSDYIFTSPIHSTLYELKFFKIWNKFDKNSIGAKAAFPGFTISILALLSLVTVKYLNKTLRIEAKFNNEKLFFLVLLLSGLIFSWGPRINFNGYYAHIPSLYYIFLKLIPFFSFIRTPVRWSFLFYFALIYYALSTIKIILNNKRSFWIISVIIILFIMEYTPLSIVTHKENYITNNDRVLKNICTKQKMAVLEIPVTHFDAMGGILAGLNYISKTELASIYNKCNLVNGYSGYDLPSLILLKDNLYQSITEIDTDQFLFYIKQTSADILVINQDRILPELSINLNKIILVLQQNNTLSKIDNNVYKINNE